MLSLLFLAGTTLMALAVYAAPSGRGAGPALAGVALLGGASLAIRGFWVPALPLAGGGVLAGWLLREMAKPGRPTFQQLLLRLALALSAVAVGGSVAIGWRAPGDLSLALAAGSTVALLGAARLAGPRGPEGSARAGALLLCGAILVCGHAGQIAWLAGVLALSASIPIWVRSATPFRSARPAGMSAGHSATLCALAVAQGALALALPAASLDGVIRYSTSARGLIVLQAAGLLAIALLARLRAPAPPLAVVLLLDGAALLLTTLGNPLLWLTTWVLLLAVLRLAPGDPPADRDAAILLASVVVIAEVLVGSNIAEVPAGWLRAGGFAIGGGLALLLGAFPRLAPGHGSAGHPHLMGVTWWLLIQPALLASLLQAVPIIGQVGGAAGIQALLAGLGALTALLAAGEAVLEGDLRGLMEHSGRVTIGLALVGIASLRPAGIAGALLISIDLLLSRGLFTALAEIASRRTSSTSLERLPDALPAQPHLRGALLAGLAALAGAPPSIGFAARLLIFGAAFTHSWPTAVLALAASALWLYAALRAIVMVAVLPPRSRARAVSRTSLALAWAPAVLGLSAGLQPARLARWLFGVGA